MKHNILETIGNRVKSERINRGYSQESFGKKVGLHRTYIGSIERGERNVSIINLVKVLNGLKINLTIGF